MQNLKIIVKVCSWSRITHSLKCYPNAVYYCLHLRRFKDIYSVQVCLCWSAWWTTATFTSHMRHTGSTTALWPNYWWTTGAVVMMLKFVALSSCSVTFKPLFDTFIHLPPALSVLVPGSHFFKCHLFLFTLFQIPSRNSENSQWALLQRRTSGACS